jgi:hypothetical protein
MGFDFQESARNRDLRAKLPRKQKKPQFARGYILLFGKKRKILKYFEEQCAHAGLCGGITALSEPLFFLDWHPTVKI